LVICIGGRMRSGEKPGIDGCVGSMLNIAAC
jgi:hypothetical protein